MGRAGAGGSGGHSAGGGHSMGHTGGGHHVGGGGGSFGGGHRAGSGGFGGPGMGPGGGFGGPGAGPHGGYGGSYGGPGGPPPHRHHHNFFFWGGPRRYYSGGPGCGGLGCGGLLAVIIILVVIGSMFTGIGGGGYAQSSNSSVSSTIEREKLDSDNAYINDCIIDELGWFNNVSATETKLKKFWNKTGVQPYIILKSYDSSLTTDDEKAAWATNYYDENFTNENIFLFVYFAEEDTDGEVGYMAYANGLQTSSVMDSEAVEIFWNYIDKYWTTEMSTDDMFVTVFTNTADTIMHVSTTSKDVMKWALILAAVIAAGIIIIKIISDKQKRAKEKAAEDERILNTPINDLADDDLTNKYL